MPTAEQPGHVPVMLAEVLDALAVVPGQTVVDATVGAGGHAEAICRRLAGCGRLIGLDRDATMLAVAGRRLAAFGETVTLVHERFSRLAEVLAELDLGPVDGVLLDLGVSSLQLDDPQRGFSFRHSGPLDMRMDASCRPGGAIRAWDIVNRWDQKRLAEVIRQYGEDRFAGRIARRICRARQGEPITTTDQLARIVRSAYGPAPKGTRRRRHDPATRTFQALRVAVNDELEELDRVLNDLPNVVKQEGRAVVISFESTTDRLVKRAFRAGSGRWASLGRSPLRPAAAEVRENPRARSAKLRAARRGGP